MSSFAAVVFDWDGTLVDSVAAIVGCTRQALADAGFGQPDEEDIRGGIGLGLSLAVARQAGDASPELVAAVVERYRHHWFATYAAQVRPFAETEGVLDGLCRGGCRLAVATAKSRRGLDADLERMGLGRFFAASRTADETASKPDPLMLDELVAELGVERSSTLLVGDTSHDLEMARRAGVAAVAVASGAQLRERLEALSPLACLDGVGELPRWLDGRAVGPAVAAQPLTAADG